MTTLRESLERARTALQRPVPTVLGFEERATALAAVEKWLQEIPEPPEPPQLEELPLDTTPHQEA